MLQYLQLHCCLVIPNNEVLVILIPLDWSFPSKSPRELRKKAIPRSLANALRPSGIIAQAHGDCFITVIEDDTYSIPVVTTFPPMKYVTSFLTRITRFLAQNGFDIG